MLALMKKPHTKITIDGRLYLIPKENKKPVLTLLKALGAEDCGRNVDSSDVLKDIYKEIPKGAVLLRGARNKEGLSQNDLAKKTGIPSYNISKMENGQRTIGEDIAKKLGKSLKIDYRILMKK